MRLFFAIFLLFALLLTPFYWGTIRVQAASHNTASGDVTVTATVEAPYTPPPGGGGGGGSPPPPSTNVVFSGSAYPNRAVTLLKDAQIATSTIAGSDGTFGITISGLSAGNYFFSLYSEDRNGIRSSLLTFPVSVTSGATTTISGIFIAPTIGVNKIEVKRGDNIAIFGQSSPEAEILIQVNSDQDFFAKTISNEIGVYLYNFDTSVLNYETHITKSRASLGNMISSFGRVVSFIVGTKNIESKRPSGVLKGDLNGDGRVNLIDFSIAAFWYKRELSVNFSAKEAEVLNGDGKINLVDFSIMAFYWTG